MFEIYVSLFKWFMFLQVLIAKVDKLWESYIWLMIYTNYNQFLVQNWKAEKSWELDIGITLGMPL